METIQLIGNLIVLTGLAVWVWRGASKDNAASFVKRVEDLDFIVKEFAKEIKPFEVGNKLFYIGKRIDDFENIHNYFSERLEELEKTIDIKKEEPFNNLKSAMIEGARIANESVEIGSKITLDAMKRSGQISDHVYHPKGATNVDEGEEKMLDLTVDNIPETIIARNEDLARQYGERFFNEVLQGMK